MRQLKKVGKASGHIVGLYIDGTKIIDERAMQKELSAYAKLIGPWAAKQSSKMLKQVSAKNAKAMSANNKLIAQGMRVVAASNVGAAATALMEEQVALIQSIPLRAGERAQKLAMEAVYNGTRADEIAKELSATGEVSESDAARIARTEVSRSNTALTHARATSIGSSGYYWRNSGDASVRHSHFWYKGKKMDGQFFRWDTPPTLDDGTTGHAGTFPNCRCYPEPAFAD